MTLDPRLLTVRGLIVTALLLPTAPPHLTPQAADDTVTRTAPEPDTTDDDGDRLHPFRFFVNRSKAGRDYIHAGVACPTRNFAPDHVPYHVLSLELCIRLWTVAAMEKERDSQPMTSTWAEIRAELESITLPPDVTFAVWRGKDGPSARQQAKELVYSLGKTALLKKRDTLGGVSFYDYITSVDLTLDTEILQNKRELFFAQIQKYRAWKPKSPRDVFRYCSGARGNISILGGNAYAEKHADLLSDKQYARAYATAHRHFLASLNTDRFSDDAERTAFLHECLEDAGVLARLEEDVSGDTALEPPLE